MEAVTSQPRSRPKASLDAWSAHGTRATAALKQDSPLSRAVVVRSGKARVDGGAGGSRTHLDGFAIRCITALLARRIREKGKPGLPFFKEIGAGKESRTLDLNLGKVALYQLSYSRISSLEL